MGALGALLGRPQKLPEPWAPRAEMGLGPPAGLEHGGEEEDGGFEAFCMFGILGTLCGHGWAQRGKLVRIVSGRVRGPIGREQ